MGAVIAEKTPRVLQRVAICILGALTPLILNLANTDWASTFSDFNWIVGVGFAARLFVLLFAGGIVAFLYTDETNYVKLFHLGIAAPALLAGFMHPSGSQQASGFQLVPAAFAESQIPSLPSPPTAVQDFAQGFFGSSNVANGYYLIVGSSATENNAKALADQVNARWASATRGDSHWSKFSATLFQGYGNSKYAVVLGANLTRQEADELKTKALQVGLPSDSYVWRVRTPLK